MLRTTLGQLLVNDALPERLRDRNRVLDKKGMSTLLEQVANEHPDEYRDISKALADIGREAATESGGNSFGLAHMKKAKAGLKYQRMMQDRLKKILDRDDLDDEQRHELIIRSAGTLQNQQADEVLAESLAEGNPLAQQVASGTRGNKMNLASLRGSDILYQDHHDNILPLPIVHSFSQGLSPVEYWANTYGARKGVMATKFATQDAGFLSKQLNQIAHRMMVVGNDYEDDDQQSMLRGYPVETGDMDNAGALLARDTGHYPKNTILTPKILKELERSGTKRLLVRSAAVGGSADGGVYARDVGVRERGTLPGRGEQIGLQTAQALSEPLSQAQLAAKHSGGVVGQEKAVGGFQGINQLIQVPETFRGGATHSDVDGVVQRIEPAPAGGTNVYINNQVHYVPHGTEVRVKRGDTVEAGDVLSSGMPDPSTVTKHKGIGEGKRYFVNAMRDAMGNAGLRVNRRNLEVLSHSLINHVRLTDELGDGVEGDVIPYTTLEHTHQPRDGHKLSSPDRAVGMYLERPVLHYTIGTKIRPSVVKMLKDYDVGEINVHAEPLAFEPEMIRGMANMQHDPDWQTRMYGSGQKASLLDAVHRGGSSTTMGTSFVPGLAQAVDFGHKGLVHAPERGVTPEENDAMLKKTPPRHALDLNKIMPVKGPSSYQLHGLMKMNEDVHDIRAAQATMEKVGRELGFVKEAVGNYGTMGNTSTGHIDRAPKAPEPRPSPLHPTTGGQAATPNLSAPRGTAPQPGAGAPKAPKAPQAPTTPSPGQQQQNAELRAGFDNPDWFDAPTDSPASAAKPPSELDGYLKQVERHYAKPSSQGQYVPSQNRGFSMSPEQLRQNIAGNEEGDFSQSHNGHFGMLARLGGVIDQNGMNTLTQGRHDLTMPELDLGDGNYSEPTQTQRPNAFANPGWSWGDIALTGVGVGTTAWPAAKWAVNKFRKPPTAVTPKGVPGASAVDDLAKVAPKVAPKAAPFVDEAARVAAKAAPLADEAVKGVAKVLPAAAKVLPAATKLLPAAKFLGTAASALDGALNVGVAPVQALHDLYKGDFDAAGKRFYDEEYNNSMGRMSYVDGALEAMGPQNFYRNVSGNATGAAHLYHEDDHNTQVGADLTQHAQGLVDKSRQWMAEHGEATSRWVTAGKPQGDWTDPQTGQVVDQATQRDFAMHAQRANMSAWELKNHGQGIRQRVMSDFVSEPVATPSDYVSGNARIPGTNLVLPARDMREWPGQWQNTMPWWLGGR